MSCFALMTDDQNGHSIPVNPVSYDIAAVTEVNQPFPKRFRKVIDQPTKSRVCTKYLHALTDGFASTARGIRVF